MATKAKEAKKESTMDLLRLGRDKAGEEHKTKLPLSNGYLEFSKMTIWDNTDGQRGVMKASYIRIEIKDGDKVGSFIIGAKKANLWVGKTKGEREEKSSEHTVEL